MKSNPKILLLAFGIVSGGLLRAEPQDNVRRTEDVIYGRKFGMALTLDVFQPPQSNGCGILFLVNGGWLSSKSTPLMVTIRPSDYQPFLERGYTVFAIVTSSQPKFTIPELTQDVHSAVRFVRTNATTYGIRDDRLGMLGSGVRLPGTIRASRLTITPRQPNLGQFRSLVYVVAVAGKIMEKSPTFSRCKNALLSNRATYVSSDYCEIGLPFSGPFVIS